MRCDQCRHWGEVNPDDWEMAGLDFRLCNAVRPRWKIQDEVAKRADMPIEDGDYQKWIAARKEALRASRACVQDGSEYMAQLVTGPDFACVLFQPRE